MRGRAGREDEVIARWDDFSQDGLSPTLGDHGRERSMHLFEFKDSFRFNESERVVCIGERALVTMTLCESELAKLFGGWIIYSDPSGLDYLGIWGARKARTLRRILRERGVDVSLSRTRPDAIRMRVRHCQFV
jgi:hypothetical protein